jgi:hypothetical protein
MHNGVFPGSRIIAASRSLFSCVRGFYWHAAAADRYRRLSYARCGRGGLQLPRISVGLWQRFGGTAPCENTREMVLRSFDAGITHFDLANRIATTRTLRLKKR